jgi:hypothetical protein
MAKYVQPNFIVDSSAAFLRNVSFDSSVYLKGVAHISSPVATTGTPYALVVDSLAANTPIKSIQLGTIATQNASDYTLRTLFDASILAITNKNAAQDTSLNALWAYDAVQDASIAAGKAYDIVQDISIAADWQRWVDSNRTGFTNPAETTISMNDTTGTFTLADVGAGWSYYRNGVKRTISGSKSVQLPGGGAAAANTYYVSIDSIDGSLSVGTTPWTLNDSVLPVVSVKWDTANTPKYWLADERHSMLIDRRIHKYLHETRGTQFVSGGALTGPEIHATADASNALGVAVTVIADEDLYLTLAQLTRPTNPFLTQNYNIYFRTAPTTYDWKLSNLPISYSGAGFIEWDNAGTLTAGSAGKYYNTYLLFTDLNDQARFSVIPGRAEFTTLTDAQAENVASYNFSGFPIAESVIAWQMTWETSAGASGLTGKAWLAAAPVRVSVTTAQASASGSGIDHNTLGGLQGGIPTTEFYHLSAAQYADYVGRTYVDGSLATRDTSLGNLSRWEVAQDASIVALRTANTNQDTSIAALDASMNVAFAKNNAQDTSLGNLSAWAVLHEASLGRLDASVAVAFTKNAAQDTSLGNLSNWNVKQDASIIRIDLYQAVQDASIIAAGTSVKAWNGLTRTDNSIGLGGTLNSNTQINTSVYQLGVLGSMNITGTLTVDGSITYVNTSQLNVSDNIIEINGGLTGVPPVNMVSGIKVNRGSSDPYFFIFSEATDTFRIGINASEGGLPAGTQAVATREDSPNSEGIAFWNDSLKRFDTVSDFTFNSTTGLSTADRITGSAGLTLTGLNASTNGYALMVSAATGGIVTSRLLGSGAYIDGSLYATVAYVDGSLAVRDGSIVALFTKTIQLDGSLGRIDASVAVAFTKNAAQDTSLGNLSAWAVLHEASLGRLDASMGVAFLKNVNQDTSISALNALTQIHDASLGFLNTYRGIQDVSIASKVSKSGDTMTGTLVFAGTGWTLDSQNITAIDTSAEGLGAGLDTHLPTSAVVRAYVDNKVQSGTRVWNGLTKSVDNSIGLGGYLSESINIDTSDFLFTIFGDYNGSTQTSLARFGQEYNQLTSYGLAAGRTFNFETAPDHITLSAYSAVGNLNVFTITDSSMHLDSSGGIYITDNSSTKKLLRYSANYESSMIDDLQIPDIGFLKTYVNASTGSLRAYIDGSLATRDASLGNLSHWEVVQDASIVATRTLVNAHDASLGRLDASVAVAFLRNVNQDTSIAALDTSMNVAFAKNNAQDTSLGNLSAWAVLHEASLGRLDASVAVAFNKNKNQDTSIAALDLKNINQDSSITLLNNWDIAQDASIVGLRSNIDSSFGLFVLKAGDTMTGTLKVDASLIVTGIATFKGLNYFEGSTYYTDVETISVSTGYIYLNQGLTGAPPSTLQSGIVVGRGTSDPYAFLYDETAQQFRIGITKFVGGQYVDASMQAVATREDAPVTNGIGFWNATSNRIDTSNGFTFVPGTGLTLPVAPTLASELTALMWNGSQVGSRDLGTMAFEASSGYYYSSQVNTLIADVSSHLDTRLDFIDVSISHLDASILSLNTIIQGKIDAVSTVGGVAGGHEVYSGENANIAYIKKIIAGSGASIISDASTITISVTGAAGYVSKYRGTFDGTAASPFSVPAGTHGLGTGPFTVTVYESNEEVYTGITCALNGDITISWASGSLADASCRFIITG